MKKTPYLESKTRKISKYVLIWTIFLLILCLYGCVKQPDAVETATSAAHQQILAIKESLPKECQTKAIEKQLKAHDATVETIKTNCDIQKAQITSEKLRWKWSFFALALVIAAYIARKVLK